MPEPMAGSAMAVIPSLSVSTKLFRQGRRRIFLLLFEFTFFQMVPTAWTITLHGRFPELVFATSPSLSAPPSLTITLDSF